MEQNLRRRHLAFALFCCVLCLIFWRPVRQFVGLAFARDYNSQIFVLAPISAWIIYQKRDEIFARIHSDFILGGCLQIVGLVLALTTLFRVQAGEARILLEIFALLLICLAGFFFCYGADAFRAARFPLLLLLFLIPFPGLLAQKAIILLQHGSADVAFALFRVLHVPVFREGVLFHIPKLDLEVTNECSGIRSSIILLITVLLIGQFALASFWRKTVFVFSITPIVIFKNGLRIVTISLLTVYVNRGFLHGWLHQSGGVVFYLLGLLALLPVLNLLRRWERTKESAGRKGLVQMKVRQSASE